MKLEISTLLGSRSFRLLAGLITAVLTSRFLGPTGRGEYFFVVTIAAVIAQFGNLGLTSSNTYQVARDQSLLPRLLTNSVWVSLVVGGLMAAVVAAGAYLFGLFGGPADGVIAFAIILAPLSLFFLLGENLLLGLGRTMLFNAVEIVSSALLVVFQLAVGLLSPSSWAFLAARSAGLIASSAGLLALLARGSSHWLAFDSTTFRRGFAYSARAYLVTLLGYLVLRVNVFLLQLHSGFGEVGLYSIATQITDALEIIPTSVSLVLFPKLVRMEAAGWPVMRRSLVGVAGIMAVACAVTGLVSEPVIRFAFGPEFDNSALMLRLLLPQVFFIGLTSVVSQYLAALGMPLALLGVWGVGLVLATLFGSLFIPAYGGAGAAVALSLTYALLFTLVLTLALARRPR